MAIGGTQWILDQDQHQTRSQEAKFLRLLDHQRTRHGLIRKGLSRTLEKARLYLRDKDHPKEHGELVLNKKSDEIDQNTKLC